LLLGRQPGLRTDPGQGLSSAHCPRCGGPATDDTVDACEFCGAVCNDGKSGWVLLDLVGASSDTAQSFIHALNGSEMHAV
jgi:hypothetical protein